MGRLVFYARGLAIQHVFCQVALPYDIVALAVVYSYVTLPTFGFKKIKQGVNKCGKLSFFMPAALQIICVCMSRFAEVSVRYLHVYWSP